MKNKLLFILAVIFSTTSIVAQENEIQEQPQPQQKRYKPLEELTLLNLSYTNQTESEFKKEGSSGKVGFSGVNFSLALPKVLKNKKTVIINGLEFSNLKPAFSEIPSGSSVDRNFYSFAYRFTFINPIGKKGWNYALGVKPTLASDFEESVSSEDLVVQTSLMVTKRSGKYFKYGFGVSYGMIFGEKLIVPILSVVYKKNNWGTYMYLPAYIAQFYHFKNSKLGLSAAINGSNYNMNYSDQSDFALDKLRYSRINIGPEFEIKLVKSLRLNLSGGITVSNKLDWTNDDGESVLDLSPDNQFFFKIALKVVK